MRPPMPPEPHIWLIQPFGVVGVWEKTMKPAMVDAINAVIEAMSTIKNKLTLFMSVNTLINLYLN